MKMTKSLETKIVENVVEEVKGSLSDIDFICNDSKIDNRDARRIIDVYGNKAIPDNRLHSTRLPFMSIIFTNKPDLVDNLYKVSAPFQYDYVSYLSLTNTPNNANVHDIISKDPISNFINHVKHKYNKASEIDGYKGKVRHIADHKTALVIVTE